MLTRSGSKPRQLVVSVLRAEMSEYEVDEAMWMRWCDTCDDCVMKPWVSPEDVLEELLTTVRPGKHSSRFMLIEGERGVGKTFLCQTLYRRLAALQPMPAFWPSDLMEPGPARLEENRHVTRPRRILIPPGTQPIFMWLGLNCERGGDGLAYNSLAAASVQVLALREALSDVVDARTAGRARGILVDLLEIAATFATVIDVTGAPLLEMGLATHAATHAAREIAATRSAHAAQRNQAIAQTVDAADPAWKTVQSYCSLLRAFTTDLGLPTLLFVDDLQYADATLLQLLDALPDEVSDNLTVICTADQAALAAQRLEAPARTPGAWFDVHAPAFSRVRLSPPAPSALEDVVRSVGPATSDDTVVALVRHSHGNPYRLRLLLDSPRAQPRGGRIELSPHEVLDFPDRFEDLYRAEWLQLPAQTRRAIAIASMLGHVAPRHLLDAVLPGAGVDDTALAIRTARRHQWLIAPASDTIAFPDESRHAVAVAEAAETDVLDHKERERIGTKSLELAIAALSGSITDWSKADPAPVLPVPEHLVVMLEAAVTLAGAYPGGTPDDVTLLALVLGAYLKQHGAYVRAAIHAERVGKQLQGRGALRCGAFLEIKGVEWWSDAGHNDRATGQLEELAGRYPAALLNERHLDRLRTYVEGLVLAREGHVEQANRVHARIAQDPHDEDGLGERSSMQIVTFSLSVGDLSIAAAEVNRRYAKQLVTTDSRWWWQQEPECAVLRTMVQAHGLTRVNAARAAASDRPEFGAAAELRQDAEMWCVRGHWLTALEVNGDLVSGLTAVRPAHPMTLAARCDGARYLSLLGGHEEALAELDRVLASYERVGGNVGSDYYVTHGERAKVLSRLGRHAEALKALRDAHARAAYDLGHKHITLTRLHRDIAYVLARKGDDDGSRRVYADVVGELEVALGASDPTCVSARADLALLSAHTARPAIAVLGDRSRRSKLAAIDERWAALYRRGQAEDWALLFGTATHGVRLKRKLVQTVMTSVLRANSPSAPR